MTIEQTEEERYFNNDDSKSYIEVEDGTGTGSFIVDLTDKQHVWSRLYDETFENSGVAHPFPDDFERSADFNAFLATITGDFKVEFIIAREDCVTTKWCEFDRIRFDNAVDAQAFSDWTGCKSVENVNTTQVVSKKTYTANERREEFARIERLAVAEDWSNRRVAAFKAHVTRRTKKGAVA